jgi:hypothetical protein
LAKAAERRPEFAIRHREPIVGEKTGPFADRRSKR